MERYRKLSEYFVSNKIFETCDYFTNFEYLSDVITINLTGSKSRKKGHFPIIRMNWVEGIILEDFIKKTTEPKTIKKISDNFLKMVNDLEDLNIAHGDLHPKNILVDDELNLKLVDYDCIYISNFKGNLQPELGDPDCQHPNRVNFPYDQNIDHFSSLVIYLALIAISKDIKLKYHKKSGEFIFSKSDFTDTTKSELFSKFKQMESSRIKLLSDKLEKYCNAEKPKLKNLRTILDLEKDIG
jgi:serine/threonine protein kinase